MPIQSFANQMTADVAAGLKTNHSRKLNQKVWKAAQRKLDALAAATQTLDLSALPGNQFEELKYTKPGYYSIRVNDQYRVIFRFENGDAYDVEITDKHTGR